MPDNKLIRVSAKTLGELALPEFCPRCFWIKKNVKTLPFQSFPSVFNDFDKLTKQFIHGWIDKYKTLPPWLQELGPIKGHIEPPGWRNLSLEQDNIILSGSPDGIFTQEELLVVDYKTARYTGNQDKLFPMYEVQLNGYAYLLEKCGVGQVGGLALIYMEPTEETIDSATGFRIGLQAHISKVERKVGWIEELVKKASEIVYGDIPVGRDKCKDCKALGKMEKILNVKI
jgi:hypothetical protein